MGNAKLGVRIWGAAGSYPRMGPEQLRFGGNTTSLEILHDGETPVFVDAGTGIANAGQNLLESNPEARNIHIFFTHYHWDHTAGLPFFVPIYQPRYQICLHGPGADSNDLQDMLDLSVSAEFSPISGIGNLESSLEIRPENIRLDDLEIEILDFEGAHPGGILCYKFRQRSRCFVFATDVEVQKARDAQVLTDFCRGADFIILDTHYTSEEYKKKKGWGHSTYDDALKVTLNAGVRRLVFFHMAPHRSDEEHLRLLSRYQHKYPDISLMIPEEGGTVYCVE